MSSPLRDVLDATIAWSGCSMQSLTVLANQNDPFRLDTDARHRDGEWLATTAGRLGLGDRTIHLRGLHYMVIGETKPNGLPYTNTDADWKWLSENAAKAARWLGYVSWDQVVDQRNGAPVVREFEAPEPEPFLSVGVQVDVPEAEDLEPRVSLGDFRGVQPYRLVLVGEKSSLEPVLAPIAESFGADLYLPTGEMSDTLIYRMAESAFLDGRPIRVFYFSDCDPAGWQMPISVARKLQGFDASQFPGLDFQVRRVGLTPDQVREYGLPSTPLKATERRADKWSRRTGVEQTEIDALAALQPDLLRRMARDALAPFHDPGLPRRVGEVRDEWVEQAQAVVDASIDDERMRRIRADAAEKLQQLQAEIDAINDALRVDLDDFDLPPVPQIPTPEVDENNQPAPLIDSGWEFDEQCAALIHAKAYLNGDDA